MRFFAVTFFITIFMTFLLLFAQEEEPIPPGHCIHSLFCMEGCSGDKACAQTCISKASDGIEKERAEALFSCAFEKCEGKSGDEWHICMKDMCKEQAEICFDGYAPAPMPYVPCEEAFKCINECAGDINCVKGCIDIATDKGREKAEKLILCIEEFCANEQWPACMHDNCQEQEKICHEDMPLPPICSDAYRCIVECKGEPTCSQKCIDSVAFDQEREKAVNVFECGKMHCAEALEYEPCLKEKCAESIKVCFENPEPKPPLTCKEAFGCLEGCGNDFMCAEMCYETLPDGEKENASALVTCLATRCKDKISLDCARNECGEKLDICFHETPAEKPDKDPEPVEQPDESKPPVENPDKDPVSGDDNTEDGSSGSSDQQPEDNGQESNVDDSKDSSNNSSEETPAEEESTKPKKNDSAFGCSLSL